MRRISFVAILALLACGVCAADTINDIFHQSQTNCVNTLTPPFSNCDVIGSEAQFDIQKAEVSVSQAWIDVTLYTNYGGGPTLGSFVVGSLTLHPGDLFFYDPANPFSYRYGAPLVDHGGMTAGNLYAVAAPPLTAFGLLQSVGDYYRPPQQVWLAPGSPLASTGTGVEVIDRGLSDIQAQYAISINIPTPATAFWQNVLSSGQVGIEFASAICANDVLAGVAVTGIPEPDPITLFGIGLAFVAGAGVWRRRFKSRRS